jgi:hypothetical protein
VNSRRQLLGTIVAGSAAFAGCLTAAHTAESDRDGARTTTDQPDTPPFSTPESPSLNETEYPARMQWGPSSLEADARLSLLRGDDWSQAVRDGYFVEETRAFVEDTDFETGSVALLEYRVGWQDRWILQSVHGVGTDELIFRFGFYHYSGISDPQEVAMLVRLPNEGAEPTNALADLDDRWTLSARCSA